MEYILQTKELTKYYGEFRGLDGLTLNVPKGSIYGFVGRNGAGKTTLIRVITGLQFPTSGEFTLCKIKNSDPKITEARRRMGAVVESPAIYLDMSARENLVLQYDVIGLPSYDSIPELLELVGLADTGKKKAKDFSLGMRQRLGIAIALAGSPDFLVLDEPINGLDPQGIIEVRELILKLNKEKNITILISSHILDELAKLATDYGFIDKGRIVKEISAKELEKSCRKSKRVTVSDISVLTAVLDGMGLDYEIAGEKNTADIYSDIDVTSLVELLSKNGVNLLTCNDREESLESFYINLVGGEES